MATMALELNNGTDARLPRILIADDQPDVLEALRLLLKGHGYSTESVTSPSALIESLAKKEFDLILMDLNYARDTTSGREGLDLLTQLQANESTPPIVVMTGWASVGLAVEAMQRGVGDFVEKPWANVRLLEILKKQIEAGEKKRLAKKQARWKKATRSTRPRRSCSAANARWKKRARSSRDFCRRKFRRFRAIRFPERGSPRESSAEITTTFCPLTTTPSGYASRMSRAKECRRRC